jgi:hypothetical protein
MVDDDTFKKKYRMYCETITEEMLKKIDNINQLDNIIKQVFNSESMWICRNIQIIELSYRLGKQLLEALYKNKNIYDINMRSILIKAWGYCVKNFESIYDAEQQYLYPYTIIKVSNNDIVEIKLEKIKGNIDNKTMFEIVYT